MENKEYIKSLTGPEDWISEETAKLACELIDEWKDLGIEVQQIAPGPDGMLGFNWLFKDWYFSLDLYPEDKRELFWENLETGEMWSASYPDYKEYTMITFICKLQNVIKMEKNATI